MIEMKHLNINFGDQVIFNDAHFKTCPGVKPQTLPI